jgi:hypothetical protein
MGTISGMTDIKTVFSFLPGIGSALCSSEDSMTAHSHFALFHSSVIYKILE